MASLRVLKLSQQTHRSGFKRVSMMKVAMNALFGMSDYDAAMLARFFGSDQLPGNRFAYVRVQCDECDEEGGAGNTR